jgi:hypothetical protein
MVPLLETTGPLFGLKPSPEREGIRGSRSASLLTQMQDSVNGGALPMDQPRTDETLRDFLERRERELTQQIRALHSQIAPMEIEITEIRRSKAALGLPPATTPADFVASVGPVPLTARGIERPNRCRTIAKAIRDKPLGEMSIKQLIIKALFGHFKEGATPLDLSHFLSETYMRAIGSGSIRPILARLREDGMVVRNVEAKWLLDPVAADSLHFHYNDKGSDADWTLRMAEKLAWLPEDDEACKQREANERAGIPQEDLQTWAQRSAGERLRRA